jgi:iron complex outermembrane receptor protein
MNRIRSRKLLGTAAFAGFAACVLSTPVAAQDAKPAADEPTSGLADIVVTARKVSEKLQDVPVTVTAFSGADLQQQNAVTVSDVAKFTPGFTIVQAPSNPTVPLFTIRGQVQNDNLATLEPSTGTYLDGVYVARAYGLNAELVDVSSVQVLKGPQGTLFGRNTSAGAVLIETNKPRLDDVSGELRAGYGRYNDFSGSAVINLPVVKDVFGLRGAIQYHRRDGYITDRATGAKYNNIDNFSGRIKALWQVAPDFSIIASADFFRYKSNGPSRELTYITGTALTYEQLASTQFSGLASVAPANVAAALRQATFPAASQIGVLGTTPNSVQLNDAPLTDTKTQTYSVTAQYDSAIGTLKAIGGYRKVTSSANIDLDGTPYLILQTTGYQQLHQYSGELQLTGKTLGGKLDYAAGVTYFTEAGNDRSTSNNAVSFVTFLAFAGALAPGLPAGTFVPNTTGQFSGDIDNKSFGIYGQATYHLTDKLSFTGGLRYSSDKKSLLTRNGSSLFNTSTYVSCNLPTITTVANSNCAAGRNDTFKRVSYTAGLDYKISPDVLIYAKAGRGYRSGGENLRANGDPATFAPFKPELNDEQEIGIKSTFLDRKLRINVAAYHNVITNAQRSLLLGVPGSTALLTVLYNAQKQQTYGIEADIAAVLSPDVTLLLGGALTDPKYKTYTQPIAFGSSVFVDHSADAFVLVPKQTFNAALDVHHQFDMGRFHGRVDVSYSSKYYCAGDLNTYSGTTITPNSAAAINSFTTPAAAIVGANVGMTFKNGLDVTLWGRNLTNNRDFTQNLYIGSLGLTSSTRREPVTYGGTVSFKF